MPPHYYSSPEHGSPQGFVIFHLTLQLVRKDVSHGHCAIHDKNEGVHLLAIYFLTSGCEYILHSGPLNFKACLFDKVALTKCFMWETNTQRDH